MLARDVRYAEGAPGVPESEWPVRRRRIFIRRPGDIPQAMLQAGPDTEVVLDAGDVGAGLTLAVPGLALRAGHLHGTVLRGLRAAADCTFWGLVLDVSAGPVVVAAGSAVFLRCLFLGAGSLDPWLLVYSGASAAADRCEAEAAGARRTIGHQQITG